MIAPRILFFTCCFASLAATAFAQNYERIDVGNQGQLGNLSAEYGEISDDGRFVVFTTAATNLGSAVRAVYVRDRFLGTTTVIATRCPPDTTTIRVSVATAARSRSAQESSPRSARSCTTA